MQQPIKGRVVAKDFLKGVGEVIVPFFEEWLDMELVQRKLRNPMSIPIKWWLKNGSVFDILTHEQSTEQFEGWKGHIAWFDEPPPRDKYVATLRGLVDFQGRNWMTLTPLTQPWIYDDIYTATDPNISVVTTDIRDNTHLSEQAIAQFESSLTEEEKEARIHGRFLHLSGLVYKEFDPNVHVVTHVPIKDNWTRYCAIDPHERKATAVLWLAVDEKDNHWIYDELSLKDMDIEQIAMAIKVQEGEFGKPRVRLIDPHADKDNVVAGGFNFRKELMRHGIFCERGNSDTMLGKARIRQALTPRYSSVLKRNVPQLRISHLCRNVIHEFQHYIWDDYKRNKDEYGLKETVKKKNDDFMDALRYIYNFGPRHFQPEDEQEEVEMTFKGEYTKYPARSTPRTGYHSLVENPHGTGAGEF